MTQSPLRVTGLAGLLLMCGCSSEPVSTFEIKRTSFNQTAMGTQRAGAVGAIVQWNGNNATVDLGQLVQQVKIVARREASARQREIAKKRGASAYRKLPATAKLAMKKRSVRYLAVETERDAKSRGRKSVMIWDTYAAEVVGNQVYDIAEVPKVGSYLRFETYAASYVGTGDDASPTPTPPPLVAEGPRR